MPAEQNQNAVSVSSETCPQCGAMCTVPLRETPRPWRCNQCSYQWDVVTLAEREEMRGLNEDCSEIFWQQYTAIKTAARCRFDLAVQAITSGAELDVNRCGDELE